MSQEKHHGGRRLAADNKGADSLSEPHTPKKRSGTGAGSVIGRWFQSKRNRIITIVVVILLVLVIGVAAAFSALFQKPVVNEAPKLPTSTESVDGEEPSGTAPTIHSGNRKEDFYTFLVIGRDTAGGGNTDTILLASYDVKNQKLNVMSIPRDTMVNIPYDIKRINAVYNYNGGGDKGMQALCDEISQLVGFVPDFQVVVEWEAVGKLVDAIGGVWFDVPVDMNYDDPTPGQDLHIHINKGYQLLDGEAAMGVVRFRHSYANGDLGRIEVQQDFLKAVVEQCLQIKNVTKIGELAEIFVKYVDTNLTVPNLLWFGKEAIFGGLEMDNVNFVTMPCTGKMVWSRSYGNYQSYVVPVEDELVDLVNECFNPFEEDLETSELDIMSVNSDGSLSSSTGKVEDSKATKPSGSSSSSGSSSGGSSSSTTKPETSTTPEVPETSAPVETTETPSESPETSAPETTAPETSTPEVPETSAPVETTPAVETPPAVESQAPESPAVSEEPVSGGTESETAQEVPPPPAA